MSKNARRRRRRSNIAVRIVFETHSISTDNEAGVATGWLPGELSPRGSGLARELGQRRRNDGINVVFSSDLRRAVQTAEIAFGATEIPIMQDARLRECNYGELNGMPTERLHAVRSLHIDTPFPGGQSYREAVDQVAAFLGDLQRDWARRRVLIIGHSATLWALEHLLEGARLEDLVAPFEWQPGWEFELSDRWSGEATPSGRA